MAGDDLHSLRYKVLNVEPSFERLADQGVSRNALWTVRSFLLKDPEQRAAAREALAHEWFESVPRLVPTAALRLGPDAVMGALQVLCYVVV